MSKKFIVIIAVLSVMLLISAVFNVWQAVQIRNNELEVSYINKSDELLVSDIQPPSNSIVTFIIKGTEYDTLAKKDGGLFRVYDENGKVFHEGKYIPGTYYYFMSLEKTLKISKVSMGEISTKDLEGMALHPGKIYFLQYGSGGHKKAYLREYDKSDFAYYK